MSDTARVLIVDDDEVVGRSFDRVLSERGYDVTTALNGQEALNKVGAEGYDLVFADIKMPGMDGLEVAKRIKEMNPWLPVVMVTGYGTEENELKAQEIGVADFLRKPVSPEVIERVTAEALRDVQTEKAAETVAAVQEEVQAVPHEEPVEEKENVAKNIALFFAAPFVGLAYIVAFPFVGFAMLLKLLLKGKKA